MIINTIYAINKSTMINVFFICIWFSDGEDLHIPEIVWCLAIFYSFCNIHFYLLDSQIWSIRFFILLQCC